MSALDRYIFDFETAAGGATDQGGDAGASDAAAGAAATDGGGQQADTGDRADSTGDAAAAAADAPAAPSFTDLLSTDEGREAADRWFEERLEQRVRDQQAREQEQQGRAANDERAERVAEALQLVGLEPEDFIEWQREQLGLDPLQTAAAQQQRQQMLDWVEGEFDRLGASDHPDLLGTGVEALAEFTDEEGAPVFKPEEIQTLRTGNREQVFVVAAALQREAEESGGQIDPARALAAAAKTVADRDALIGRAAVERFKKEITGVATAPRTTDGSGAGIEGIAATGDELAYVRQRLQPTG